MKKIKRGFFIIFCAVVVFALYNYKMTFYLLSQLKGQLTIVYKAESIDEAIASKKYDSLQTQKLILIKAIKQFAEDSLGLSKTKNYSTIYNQQNRLVHAYDSLDNSIVWAILNNHLKALEDEIRGLSQFGDL
ncbi:MAG TPA: aminopeptidase [Bacteroidia bacterium]|nr:aminopeptidase [Bacteroidia bacterium]